MDQYDKSIENANEAIAICESLYGRDNINTAQFYIGQAWFYEKMGNEEEATILVQTVLDIINRHNSIANITVAQTYLTAGDIYLEQGCFEDTFGCYHKSWLIYQGLFFDENIYASEFDERLGKLYVKWNVSEDYDNWVKRWKDGELTDEEK